MYFKGVELTGSSEGTAKEPKMSLLKVYQETIIPALEQNVVQQYSENGQVKIVIVLNRKMVQVYTPIQCTH